MTATQILKFLQEEIHTTVAATVDDNGLPVTCAIDMMDADKDGLYFLTAKGKGVYMASGLTCRRNRLNGFPLPLAAQNRKKKGTI